MSSCMCFHTQTLFLQDNEETALHLAIDQEEDGYSLHLVDFILQNSTKWVSLFELRSYKKSERPTINNAIVQYAGLDE